jgi:hypothetical protein
MWLILLFLLTSFLVTYAVRNKTANGWARKINRYTGFVVNPNWHHQALVGENRPRYCANSNQREQYFAFVRCPQ